MRRTVVVTAAACLGIGLVAGLGVAVLLDDEEDPADQVEEACERVADAARDAIDADLVVFLQRETTESERQDLEEVLSSDENVASVDYIDESEARAEFARLFEGNAAMLERLEQSPDLLPESFRINVVNHDPATIDVLEADLATRPEVLRASSTQTLTETQAAQPCPET